MPVNTVAVIVTFNRLEKLQTTLAHTLTQPFSKVVVVDNCSTDGTRQWLQEQQDERLLVLYNEQNLGGAGGFHRGFEYAALELPEADWLVCFDDDAFPQEGMLERFNKLNIPEDVGSLGGAVYLPSGRISEMNRPSLNPFWHLRKLIGTAIQGRHGFHVSDEDYNRDTTMDIDTSSFVGCFVRLALIREGKIGLPRSELFIYADDIIYVLELRKRGYRHWFAPMLKFTHDCQTLIDQRDVYHPLWKVYYTFRNRLELYRLTAGLLYPLVLVVKVPGFFLTVRHYEPDERMLFLHTTRIAVWDGVRRDYCKSHSEVVRLSSPPASGPDSAP